jgi:hypothetical protein
MAGLEVLLVQIMGLGVVVVLEVSAQQGLAQPAAMAGLGQLIRQERA